MGEIRPWSGAGWRWVQRRKQAVLRARAWSDRHWPAARRWRPGLWSMLAAGAVQWRACLAEGFRSLVGLGSAALFLIMWSCFLSFTSATNVVYVLLFLGASGAAIRCLGYTPGLFIVGLFGILIMWIHGNLLVTGMMFIVAGYIFSLNHARFLIFLSTSYAVYFVNARIGWLGVFLSLNLAFLSHDLVNKLLQGYDGVKEGPQVSEPKVPESVLEDFIDDFAYSAMSNEEDKITSSRSSCKTPATPNVMNIQKNASPSKVVRSDSSSMDEMKRIISSSNHYEALGVARNKNIDLISLRKEYRKKAMLVHPDKNMGNPIASESFKRLQCAYEVLSDSTKKKNYDDILWKETSTQVCQKSSNASQKNEMDFRSEESRHIECSKCGNPHIWICTSRSKARARWCQECSMYHQARDGDGWVECGYSPLSSSLQKGEIPRAFVCAESKIFDVSEWALCQGMVCKPNTHRSSFHVNMVGIEKSSQKSNSFRFPWSLDAELASDDDEFELWLQQALASGLFSETPKRRKSWSPFKINQKGMNPWRRSP